MGKVIQFPQPKKRVSELVDDIIENRMLHRDPEVLDCLKGEMKRLVERYFSGDEFTATLLLPPDLTDEQFQTIEKNFRQTFHEHNDRMLQRANAMFLELCMARMAICEFKHGAAEDRD